MSRLLGFLAHILGTTRYFSGLQPWLVRNGPHITIRRHFQVSILGGSNPVAQTLCLLLKEHPFISRLLLLDCTKSTCGVAMDLSHIPSEPIVQGLTYSKNTALASTDIVVVASAEPRKLFQTDYDLFRTNTSLIINSMKEICTYCPKAFIVDLTEPINYTVPFISLVLEASNAYDKGKVLGVTGRDAMRAQACLQQLYKLPPDKPISVPVICGHSPTTTVPLLSHVTPWFNVNNFAAVMITEHVRGTENKLITVKGGEGQSSISMAYAGFWTVAAILKALSGCPMKHIAFVANDEYKTKYFAAPATITKDGITEVANYKVLSILEAAYLQNAIRELANDVSHSEMYFKELKEKNPFKI
ncbi:malate dehydrogenase-like [Choristoneura fumiferana]|uniref:malate dehydrogenase-like n=1 Tax=Choristoneura fumiferana TaxID=7141 RepID=UPI003D15CA41